MTHDSENAHRRGVKHKAAFGFLFLIVMLLVTLSFAPLIDSNRWWIRILDFPRLQVGIALLILAVPLVFYLRYFQKMAFLALALIVSALSYHGFILLPYFPLEPNSSAADCESESAISVMIANVQMSSDPDGGLVNMVLEVNPELFLAMETNAKWNEALDPLNETMPYSVSHISEANFGIHLFSRQPLDSPEIMFLAGQDTPQVVTGVTLTSEEKVNFIGVHPHPPLPSQVDTTLGRDAVLYEAALLLREYGGTGIVAGDFNATPWEATVTKMRQIGNLEEPRRGYGYIPTFNANSWWMSWPLDHIFHQAGFTMLSLERLSSVGSDHYPLLGRFCLTSEHGEMPAAQTEKKLIKEAEQAIKTAKEEPAHARSRGREN